MLLLRILKWLAWLSASVVLLALVLLWLMLESQPLVVSDERVSPEVASQAEQVLQRSRRAYLRTELELSADEANALITIGRRLYPQVHGRVNIAGDQLLAAVSIPVVNRRYYINVSTLIRSSQSPVFIEYVRIGRLQLPGRFALWLAETAGNIYFRGRQASLVRQAIQQVRVEDNRLVVQYQWPERFEINTLLQLRDQWQPFGDPARIQHYYQLLATQPVQGQRESLVIYLELLFREAGKRSTMDKRSSAMEENQSALLALAVFLGGQEFELVLGNVRGSLPARNQLQVTLADRVDLQLHFVFSAAIKTLTNKDIGFLAGEMKELLDTNPGGSGFSFADLMADKAGVRFAEVALASEDSARFLQAYIRNGLTEQQILPDIRDLPEGISYDSFKLDFEHLDSEAYLDMLAFIKQELDALPLYQQRLQ